jgi:hypothetical protein
MEFIKIENLSDEELRELFDPIELYTGGRIAALDNQNLFPTSKKQDNYNG